MKLVKKTITTHILPDNKKKQTVEFGTIFRPIFVISKNLQIK